ncbi:MAG: tyrosine-type recombinase/integrase [Chloroflexi bacterium]|nr:tyrosine-type recombinase/integrase [Chloroflexota bacterium]
MLTIKQAIANYLRDLAVGQSAQTVETYSQGLKRFIEFISTTRRSAAFPASRLSVDDALDYARWLSEARPGALANADGPIAKSTLRTYLASASRFYSYLLRERIVDVSASDMERMREAYRLYRRGFHRPLPKLPPEEAVRALLAAARRVKVQPRRPRLDLARLRDIAMLEALRSSGMRVGELVGLRRDNLDYRQHTARVTGKGGKQRVVYFDDEAWNAMQSYLKARADGARGRAMYELPLFARHDRRAGSRVLPLTTDSVRLVFGKLARDAEIEIAMTPHSLRHAFATKMLEATGDLALVQDMLGHSSPATTRIYAKVSSKRLRDAHRTVFKYEPKEQDEDSTASG